MRTTTKLLKIPLVALALSLSMPRVFAHKPSDSYLNLKIDAQSFSGNWEIALKDLEYALGLDSDNDGVLTWGEIKARFSEIDVYASNRLKFSQDGLPIPIVIQERLIEKHSDGGYLLLKFTGPTHSETSSITIRYGLFFDLDPQHRGLLKVAAGENIQSFVFSPEGRDFVCARGTFPNHITVNFVHEGVHHIWFGFDHILFLLALLLPAVMGHSAGQTDECRNTFGTVLMRVLRIVTAFTVAHSLTLSMAALGLLNPPSRLIESAIALSVILAALNNLLPFFRDKSWMVAFGFGLIHGFGFANALRETGLERFNLALPLFGFNAGVELGQLAIVAFFLPVAFILRKTWFYQRISLRLGSGFIAAIAAVWMTERVFDLKLIPF